MPYRQIGGNAHFGGDYNDISGDQNNYYYGAMNHRLLHEICTDVFLEAHPDLNTLLSPLPEAAYNGGGRHVGKCLPGTRVEVIDVLKTWMRNRGDRWIFWLNGPAGSGKSALAQTIAEWADENGLLAASFIFFRGAGDRSRFTRFISTLSHLCSPYLFLQLDHSWRSYFDGIHTSSPNHLRPKFKNYSSILALLPSRTSAA